MSKPTKRDKYMFFSGIAVLGSIFAAVCSIGYFFRGYKGDYGFGAGLLIIFVVLLMFFRDLTVDGRELKE